MLTKTAQIDLEQLRANGFQPTDAEIVALNDLAKRIEYGKDITPANMPRVAFAGNVVLHEPTIGSLEWWMEYGHDAAWSDRMRLMTYFFMLANATDIDYLDTLRSGHDIRKAVKRWMKKCSATEAELWRALMWVKCGSEDAARLLADDGPDAKVKDEEEENALWMSLIAAASALGTSPSSLKTQTQSTLNSLLVQANMRQRIPMKASVAREYIEYRKLLRQIEDRGKATDDEEPNSQDEDIE